MSIMKTDKYIKIQTLQPSHHPELTGDPIHLDGTVKDFGNREFKFVYECITKPGEMVTKHHKHDFDQYLNFFGGDPTNMLELNGEVELILSEDGINLERHIITQAVSIYIPAGLYHCPLIFRKVTKPFLFVEVQFTREYKKTVATPEM